METAEFEGIEVVMLALGMLAAEGTVDSANTSPKSLLKVVATRRNESEIPTCILVQNMTSGAVNMHLYHRIYSPSVAKICMAVRYARVSRTAASARPRVVPRKAAGFHALSVNFMFNDAMINHLNARLYHQVPHHYSCYPVHAGVTKKYE